MTTTTTSYADNGYWQKQMAFLPEALHLATPPTETTWASPVGHFVHVDVNGDRAASPVTLILLHGVGTNARQMSLLVGAPLARLHGLHSLALDCPGYGQTVVKPGSKVRSDRAKRHASNLSLTLFIISSTT